MSGFHHCEHCKTWHYCNKPSAGCGAVLLTLLALLFLSPLLLVTTEVWLEASCDKWPNWAKGCETTRTIFTNGDLEERVKTLEQHRPTPSPTPDERPSAQRGDSTR